MNGVIVIGAGPAGLACAGALRSRGVSALVIDAADAVASSWRRRYRGLRLNTPRELSHLPGARIPPSFGRWVRREDFIAYLDDYAKTNVHRLRLGVKVDEVRRRDGAWSLDTSDGELSANAVVVATGYDRVPKLPAWPGVEGFTGELLHAADYHEPSRYAGRDVLVVGAGTSGNEIAVAVLEAGAHRVRVAIRGRQTIFPREWHRIPMSALAYPRPRLRALAYDVAGRALERAIWGDLRRLGFDPPPVGMGTMLERRGHGVAVDSGLVDAVRAGRIELVPALEGFDEADAILAGDRRIAPEVVIAATGYHCALERLVGHLPGVLRHNGLPAIIGGEQAPGLAGLHFIGYRLPLSGKIPELRRDARAVAAALRGVAEPQSYRLGPRRFAIARPRSTYSRACRR